MLEDFENLDYDLQKHFIQICGNCKYCNGCTKNGRNEIFTVKVNFEGKEYNLCPNFPQHSWDTFDRDLIDVLFKYHNAQEVYGNDWRK